MISDEEHEALRLWFDAFDPAVRVELTPDAVCLRSTRRNRAGDAVYYCRTCDLQQDLSSALSQLVHQSS
jgi:hypothetical protein